ncbi:hypothetical protein [Methylobacterium isbiliense]|uniref:Uncharacterized protein n=1 Tax=Methylobacterium isbiliense TaxID=315478 RepID=A0ABQ4SQY4_9HYPH|nr:hypothetical protein [Methylobacterium isbiliense]MDN3626806.1 hypothetical protein [Methylobacterium isbiliense]GJE04086.1 hypothetical protein GMJLKIPL_6046 [Methylobacterium isbiliense]
MTIDLSPTGHEQSTGSAAEPFEATMLALSHAISDHEERRRAQLGQIEQLARCGQKRETALLALGRTENALALMRSRQSYLRTVLRLEPPRL